ncbi:MAG: hypothetical protein OIF50_17870 [Flavobacteriaceae bacterium]|nr:hypothetical protein [Flavobacteriaceae bacterium]
MKTILTIITLATFTFTAQAKDNKEVNLPLVKIEKTISIEKGTETARIHKNKNYKVIKALNFSTKKKSMIA